MEFDEDPLDDQWDDELDNQNDLLDEYVDCPFCGANVYELADQCPACGAYITHSASPFTGKPWWWIALGLLGMAVLATALLF